MWWLALSMLGWAWGLMLVLLPTLESLVPGPFLLATPIPVTPGMVGSPDTSVCTLSPSLLQTP